MVARKVPPSNNLPRNEVVSGLYAGLLGRAEMNAAARHSAIAIAKTKGTAKKYFQTRMAFTTKEAKNAAMSGRT
jgi:hypothetical protein